ncbi:hypothetical protein AQUCO_00200952v1 [Aquilegia coerulea]|uniref:BHLH domain-containing protein n=1 Tax=Aquilegia coerulea TaxID=218851 RepID=A0A2G5F5J4_AQUCA|nr:hypothetical protein AQUCO_00200952v1 [Aquilegia coerulea]
MELPQPRPIGNEGKKPTHDFLSLYSHSSFPDPRPSQGNGLRTHDFLQPLERVAKNNVVGEKLVDRTKGENPSPSSSSSPSVEHILPGGIGTYTISHISNFSQRVPKTEQAIGTVVRGSSAERSGEINIANSSTNGGVFAFWEESTVKDKGKKVNIVEAQVAREQSEKLGQWSSERPLQTPSPTPPPSFLHCNSFNSLSSSKQSIKSQSSFMEMMKSGRGLQEEEDDDDEEYANSSKKSSSSQKDGKSGDQKANTPRSKHSATEQRRRSKINDRFQILRDLIPQNDQKRDKASFLLEVIEYIQYLQEKVNRYEVSYQGWNQEPTKLTPWRNGHAPSESMADHSQTLKSGPSLMFTGKFDDNTIPNPTILATTQSPVDPGMSTSATYKTMDHHAEGSQKSGPMPIPVQPNIFVPAVQHQQQSISEVENMVPQPQAQLWPNRPCTTQCPDASDTLNEHEDLAIEGGTISLAGVYSQGAQVLIFRKLASQCKLILANELQTD